MYYIGLNIYIYFFICVVKTHLCSTEAIDNVGLYNNNNNNMFIDVKYKRHIINIEKNISQIRCANYSEIRLYVINSALMATQQIFNSAKCVIRKKRRITF